MGRFDNQTVLITGASQGVGLACARRFLAEGARVSILARRADPLEAAATGLDASDRVLWRAADVTDDAAMAAWIAESIARFGRVDGLVNNAGAHHRGVVVDQTPDALGQMVDVNLKAPITLSRRVLPHLLETGGFIVNVASLAGKVALDGAATYSATKFALRAFTVALAHELRDTEVRVSAVCPGPIDTGFIMDDLASVSDLTFSQPLCSADHVAGMVLDCAEDGRVERDWPWLGGKLATVGYVVPALRALLRPVMEAKGRRVKARLLAQRHGLQD